MANPKDPAKPVARSPGFWENLMSPKPKGPATSLRNATTTKNPYYVAGGVGARETAALMQSTNYEKKDTAGAGQGSILPRTL